MGVRFRNIIISIFNTAGIVMQLGWQWSEGGKGQSAGGEGSTK